MKTLHSIFILLMLIANLSAQELYDANWLFGFTGANDSISFGVQIRFTSDSVSIYSTYINQNIAFANTTMSSKEGDLLFYTNGCIISNAFGEMIENGDSLNPGEIHNSECSYGYIGRESIQSIAKPGSESEFYIFHQKKEFRYNPFGIESIPLYLTIVDMAANDGEGTVSVKNKILLNDKLHSGHINAVRHTNGEDWWLLGSKRGFGDFYRFLIRADTIEGPYYQSIEVDSLANGQGGQFTFSPDGNKFIEYKIQDGVNIYDFDRSTGQLSNYVRILLDEFTLAAGCAVSSNSRFLYVNTAEHIYQFDLEAADIADSKILVATYDGYLSPFPTRFFLQQLAPDCRIYITSPSGVDVLHVINHPNRHGLDCEVIQHGVQLPSVHGISLPNFPSYRTGTAYPICDSTLTLDITTPVFDLPDSGLVPISIYPNPVVETLNVKIPSETSGSLSWQLYDGLGKLILSDKVYANGGRFECSLKFLPAGIYFYRLEKEGQILASGKIIKE